MTAKTKTFELDVPCRSCRKLHAIKPRRVNDPDLQDAVIERHLRRYGWTGQDTTALKCPRCSKENAS